MVRKTPLGVGPGGYICGTGSGGPASASLSCEMYDEIARASGKSVPPAEPADVMSDDEIAEAVLGTYNNKTNTIPATVSRIVKQAGADTMIFNALRDGAKFAWIPKGDSPCEFCITLASRGWQKISKRSIRNGHAEHIHANCQCEYAVSFDDDPVVPGYDPDHYLDEYHRIQQEQADRALEREKKKREAGKKKKKEEKEKEEEEEEKDEITTAVETVIKDIETVGIKKHETKRFDETPSEEDLIKRIGGGDLTRGSCSSLALAFLGAMCGIDVLDFRDGESRFYFASGNHVMNIARAMGGEVVLTPNGFTGAHQVLKKMEEGKLYYFAAGRHAAVVRRTALGWEYLELQSRYDNGWHTLTDERLKTRFKVQKARTSYGMQLTNDTEFFDMSAIPDHLDIYGEVLGYINTPEDEQRKGEAGGEK